AAPSSWTQEIPQPRSARSLVRLSVEPANVVLSGAGACQQFVVTGHYADGSVEDLTASAGITVDRSDLLRIEGSVVHANGDGAAQVTATSGGLQVATRVTIKNTGITPLLSFRNDVMPIFSKGGCNAGTCHGNFNGKNGFRLSLRGESPAFDLDS